jgi:NADH:ubiquinone oxidoreductase subunit E
VIDTIIEQYKDLPGATMVVLNELQSAIGFVSTYMQEFVAERLQVPLSRVHGVVSFYSLLYYTTHVVNTL